MNKQFSIAVEERRCTGCNPDSPDPLCPKCEGSGSMIFFLDTGNFDQDYRSRMVINSIQFYYNKWPFMSIDLQTGKTLLTIPFEKAAALFWEVLILNAKSTQNDAYIIQYQGVPVFMVNVTDGVIEHAWQSEQVKEFFSKLERMKPERLDR